MGTERIAIIGIGLRYPDASSPEQFWENMLAGRRGFRRLPDQRMAAVLQDAELASVVNTAAGSTSRSVGLVRWLALNVASLALADARFLDGAGLPRQSTGVVLGDSLTAELSRASIMRSRWPQVRGAVAAELAGKGWPAGEIAPFLRELKVRYLAPLPPTDDAAPGGLAGGICDYFELGGMAYTLDGVCASSLLSVAIAAKSLADGELDVAIAGGVELPIDPFDAAGGETTVSHRDSNGFWPGEGAGLVVLMRERDALAQRRRIYASLAGWGVAADGWDGDTARAARGCRQALRRAYDRAGYGIESVSYFEGQGSAIALDNAAEIEMLSAERRLADGTTRPAALGSVAGNVGHTGAAAGIAGLIKAALSVHHQVIPPSTGHHNPHPALLGDSPMIYLPDQARLWPTDVPIRAGVSAASSGGINTHVAIEQVPGRQRRSGPSKRTSALVNGRQDVELLMLDAPDAAQLRDRVARLAGLVPKLAFAELADLAGALAPRLRAGPFRAAVVATSPDDAGTKLDKLIVALDSGHSSVFAADDGLFLGNRATPPKIAYMFPGQGCGHGAVGAIQRRFVVADAVFRAALGGDHEAAAAVQPRIVASSLAALRVLHTLGIDADVAVGHSLGELTALAWGGAMGGAQLLRLATARGQIMAQVSRSGGAMASLATGAGRARQLIDGGGVVLAGYNAPRQTVISGVADAVDRVCAKAQAEGVRVTRIDVSHAFHSPLVRAVADVLTERLAEMRFAPLHRPVVSTVTGDLLDPATDLRTVLRGQVVLPVRFHEAAAKAVAGVDLAVEVGPGSVLTGLLAQIAPRTPVLSVDTDDRSLAPLLRAVGAAHALGVAVETVALFAGRMIRPLPYRLAPEPADRQPEIASADTCSFHDVDLGFSTEAA